MIGLVIRRLASAIPSIIVVGVAVFAMVHLTPGDPVDIIASGKPLTGEQRAALREALGLDQPLLVQFLSWAGDALHGDLGRSIQSNRSVSDAIVEQLPFTLRLAAVSAILGAVMGCGFGIVGALFPRRWPDTVSRVVSLVGVSVPSFWIGILLIMTFAIAFPILPYGGQGSLASIVMPAFTLGIWMAAVLARTLRASLLETLGADYVRTARAKGLRGREVLIRHALRTAILPTLTVFGVQLGFLLSGTMVIETVFSRQGLGRLTIEAVLNKDFPLIQGTVIVSALMYIGVNLLVDVASLVLDPRLVDNGQ